MGESIMSWCQTYSSIKSMYSSDLWTVLLKGAAARTLQRSLYPVAAYRRSQQTLGRKQNYMMVPRIQEKLE